ncbi:MAG: hypothetical protein LBC37_02260 [Zoogloeaceae bacterium]|jgi:hypothetical protein|nr:hypothetical protein [Zoogloeaceae bacterium]
MERLTIGSGQAGVFRGLRDAVPRSVWAIRQQWIASTRFLGVWGWSLLVTGVLALGALAVLNHQQGEARVWQSRYAAAQDARAADAAVQAPDPGDGRQRLVAFEQLLLPHQDIPLALQDLLRLAEDDGLSIQRAEYQAQVDIRGAFTRYRINLPVRGTAEAVNRYIYAALLQQKNLALESVQLKRDTLDASGLEARIQWVLLTHLPPQVEIRGGSQ